MKLNELIKKIKDRKEEMPEGSYTTSLLKEGLDRVAQKVGEEAVEVVIAAKNNNKTRTVSEIADLIYHLLVLMSLKDISIEEIEKELGVRAQ